MEITNVQFGELVRRYNRYSSSPMGPTNQPAIYEKAIYTPVAINTRDLSGEYRQIRSVQMKRIVFLLLAWTAALSCGVCFGNPIAIPRYILDAENVLVAVTAKGAVVTGNYHFKWNKEMQGKWEGPAGAFWLQLPVPVFSGEKSGDALKANIAPMVILNGKSYSPDERTSRWVLRNLPENMKVVIFDFSIDEPTLGENVELKIQYHQPILKTNGVDMVYYIPFLPFESKNADGKPINQQRYAFASHAARE